MTTDPASLLPVALRAADAAAEMMRNRRPASVTEKHDRDLVSDVDIAIERQLRRLMADATPQIGFLGEEEGRTGETTGGWLWTLDPIDGTSNYAHGIPLCAMSLALLHDRAAVLGVIDAPFLGHRYHAVEGHGAFAGDRQISVSRTRQLRDAVVAVGDYATGPGADRDNEARLALTVRLASRAHRLRMIGSAALDLAWVAEGRLDCSVTLGNKPWDTAAGVLIARESGARVVDGDGSPHTLDSAYTIASTPGLIDQLLLLIGDADGIRAAGNGGDQARAESPNGALDRVLSASPNLIFEFDGPVCDVSAALQADAGEQLLSALPMDEATRSVLAARPSDLYDLVAAIAAIDADLARQAEARLAELEMTAAGRAAPSGYVHEAIAACRDSGRTPVIAGRQSVDAIRVWLTRFGLDDQVRHIFGMNRHRPAETDILLEAAGSLGARVEECAVIARSPLGVASARDVGMRVIGYARTQADAERLTGSGADCVVLSLADLTLRLRARPLVR